jgi:hypothetical protein
MRTGWHTGTVEDEIGHSGAKQLFNGIVVWSIFYNGVQVNLCHVHRNLQQFLHKF